MVADAAGRHGLSIAFEPLALRRGATVATLPETIDVLDKANRSNIGILLDMWHCWPEENLHARIRQYVDRIMGIQVNDVRDPERSWCDRVFPGEGRDVCTPMLATLIDAGFNGWYDFEVFSDDGRWGNDFPELALEDAARTFPGARPHRLRQGLCQCQGDGRGRQGAE